MFINPDIKKIYLDDIGEVEMYMNSFQATVVLRGLHRICVEDRDILMGDLKTSGISSGIHYAATHTHPVYHHKENTQHSISRNVDRFRYK